MVTAWAAGALPALAVIGAFDLERLEGIHDLRAVLALVLVGAFAARSVVLARVSARYAKALGDVIQPEEGAGSALAIARTSFVVATFLVLWSGPLFLASLVGPTAVGLVLPLLCLRGMSAPGWLARAGSTKAGGLQAFFAAFSDNSEQRGEGVVVELLVLLGVLGLTLDLFGALAVILLLLRAILGIDLALLDGFLSPRNTFAFLGLGLTAMVLFEPLRAALSAIVFTGARVRADGLDVRAAVDEAIEHTTKRAPKTATLATAALLVLTLGANGALAQGTARTPEDDLLARQHAAEILLEPAYEELDDVRGRGIREAIERWLAELLRETPESSPGGGGFLGGVPLPGPEVFVVLAVVAVLLVLGYLVVSRERPETDVAARPASVRRDDPRDRAPSAWIDDAAALAEAGRLREALRALYLATLVALDRQRVIAFDPALTNWQYLRQIPNGWRRSDFRELTRLFDHKWYGKEETLLADYTSCRALAERLVTSPKENDRGAT